MALIALLALMSRRAIQTVINRRYGFAMASVSCITAKLVHIYAHFDALPTSALERWGPSFFAQDTAFLLALRILLDNDTFSGTPWLELLARAVAQSFISFVFTLALISITFFAMTSSEIQWRNVGVAADSNAWSMLATGLVSLSMVLLLLLLLAGIFQTSCDAASMAALNILQWPFKALHDYYVRKHIELKYTHASKLYYEGQSEDDHRSEDGYRDEDSYRTEEGYSSEDSADCSTRKPIMTAPQARSSRLLYVVVAICLAAQIITTILRPTGSSFIFMSWTLPLMPFADWASAPSLASLLTSSEAVNGALDNATALAEAIKFSWLPEESLAGFEDWYEEGKEHYLASEDPLKLTNLDDDPYSALKGKLADINIRHVMIVALESTRKDVFPIKKEEYVWERLEKSFKDKTLPEEAQKRLSTLTPTANFLTGEFDDGFDHEDTKPRGGINVKNALTASTYSLKSLTGTLCGVSPLLADMNVECDYHIYQPCLPQILQMLNKLEEADEEADKKAKRAESESESEKAFASFKWKTAFMQSVTGNYDRQTDLMTAIGFGEDEFLAWSYLKNESNPLGVVDLPDINYYGMAEEAIEGYVRAMFKSAKENDERVFLGHLTSTTHHDFGLPEEVESVQMAGNADNEDLSSYLNAVGYVDGWLGRILKLLEEEGVAEETLLIVQGDHGLSIAERGTLTAYSNPHIGNYHIPLVFSHPKMPQIDVDEAVISSQILPTLLDLLVETGSLSTAGTEAISDLLHNYEGQSMIRPLHQYSEETGQGGWQFTVMNPGGSTVMVRDARNPHWRMMVPIFGYYEWRFTNLEKDRHEVRPILTYDFDTFIPAIEEGYGEDAAKWAEEAVAVSKWWAEENHKRWRYES